MATPANEPNDLATVFIVDDDDDVRQTVALLARSAGFAAEVYGSAMTFLEHFDPNKAGCLVLDVQMPGMSGLELQEASDRVGLMLPIIFITAHGEVLLASQAIRAGAVDFIQKPFSPELLRRRICEAVDTDQANRRERASRIETQERLVKLTRRERDIMAFLVRGESTKQIAQRLSISPKTVDNHRAKILEKMNVDNPTQLAHAVNFLRLDAPDEP